MLTDDELTDMRACLDESLPDTATIRRRTLTVDTYGGRTDAWATAATVACRVSPAPLSSGERPVAGGEQAIGEWLVTLPANTDVRSTDRIVVGTRTFEVTIVLARRTFELHTGVRCQEVT